MQPHTAEAALYALDSVVSARYPHGVLATAAWRLRHDLSYYDALYVALATRLGDARLARSPGLPCAVELIT
jgi:predicted nucleic acid-binding protein